MKFNFVFLGQSVLRYQVPLNIFNAINQIYEQNYNKLPAANAQLVGKIQSEKTLYYMQENDPTRQKCNFLTKDIVDWFDSVYDHYLYFNDIKDYNRNLNSVWVNEMKAGEYNPVHVHQGTLFTGLSSVMVLKLPSTYGVEYSSEIKPQNGKLQILGPANGQFAKVDYQPPMELRDFYVFPYDMRHCVYPFNSTEETRRTLAANCDVDYNPINNRGVE
jgi:hypothetical protein